MFCFLSVYASKCGLRDAVKDVSQYQYSSSHNIMVIVMTTEAVQAQITKTYMAAVGMASQPLILRVRGYRNMHWFMTCSYVTGTSRKATLPHYIQVR